MSQYIWFKMFMNCPSEAFPQKKGTVPVHSSAHAVTLPLHLSRPVEVRRHMSWHLAAWGIPLPCKVRLLAIQRSRTQSERKKLSRSALNRQNLAKARFSPAEKRYGHFKQPCQRLYNYWAKTNGTARSCLYRSSLLTIKHSGFSNTFAPCTIHSLPPHEIHRFAFGFNFI